METFEAETLVTRPNWASRLVEVLQPVSVRADRLAAMDVFSGLTRGELEFAAGILRETLIERGKRMTVQAQSAPYVWLLIEGKALVSADARPIRVVGYGDFVGLVGMRYSIASPETTISLSPIRAFEVDRKGFAQLHAKARIRKRLAAAEATLGAWSRRSCPAKLRSSAPG